ncbi:hypothetical protein [Sporomusa malonica]|uniref:Uncharacterized protein n=1 Tax=Sporomusa malonica TaxID=112901 RepID=A0A1W2AT94_9FIRM|nr:hypothetical protein [Sporomusa malonica]SMC63916.1 hypothetical protein SAMN04488500_10699 [Sporomusa malonica]
MAKIKIYKVCSDSNWCAFKTIDSAVALIAAEIEAEAEDMKIGEETRGYYIAVTEMTEEEYDNLPDFNGF